jgi:membrane complex biogenesis BtpA family protein
MAARLVGVLHLAALPGSPRFDRNFAAVVDTAVSEARVLAECGFDAVMVENFGDVPFVPDGVAPITIAAMTRVGAAVRDAAPGLSLGINVLRNDAHAALAIAAVCGGSMIRINVHSGARLTDQGVIAGRAHETLRTRRALELGHVKLWCDVAVKHAAALAPRPLSEEAEELAGRALADAVLVTGSGTGARADSGDIATVLEAVRCPVFIASGCTPSTIGEIMAIESGGRSPHGVIVGSTLRKDGRAGAPLDPEGTKRLAEAFHRAVRE